jgi:hypothetical protein
MHEKQWVLIVSSWFAISRRESDTNLCEAGSLINPVEVKVENAKH